MVATSHVVARRPETGRPKPTRVRAGDGWVGADSRSRKATLRCLAPIIKNPPGFIASRHVLNPTHPSRPTGTIAPDPRTVGAAQGQRLEMVRMPSIFD